MYAVIKTGGKQYRVQAGDLLVVEKLDGKPGAKLAFDEVLLIGEGASVKLGEPTIKGASVSATLIETRKGVKIKVFKKIRRQGYRRTGGHRQFQSVLRVTGIAGAGKQETWDGTVDLTPLAVLNARARNLARGMEAALARRSDGVAPRVAQAPKPTVGKAKSKPASPPETAKSAAKTPPAKAATPKKKTAVAKAAATEMKAAKAKAPAKPTAAKVAAAKTQAAKKPGAKPASKSTTKSAAKPAKKT